MTELVDEVLVFVYVTLILLGSLGSCTCCFACCINAITEGSEQERTSDGRPRWNTTDEGRTRNTNWNTADENRTRNTNWNTTDENRTNTVEEAFTVEEALPAEIVRRSLVESRFDFTTIRKEEPTEITADRDSTKPETIAEDPDEDPELTRDNPIGRETSKQTSSSVRRERLIAAVTSLLASLRRHEVGERDAPEPNPTEDPGDDPVLTRDNREASKSSGRFGSALSSLFGSLRKKKSEDCCSICLEPYREGDVVATLKSSCGSACTHKFKKDCILEWLQDHDDCPLCRNPMVDRSWR